MWRGPGNYSRSGVNGERFHAREPSPSPRISFRIIGRTDDNQRLRPTTIGVDKASPAEAFQLNCIND